MKTTEASWDKNAKRIVDEVASALVADLGDRLLSVVVHGSLAMGCYHPPKSDVDLLAVVRASLTVSQKRHLHRELLEIHDRGAAGGGIEISIVTAAAALSAQHPMSFELHFSGAAEIVDAVRRGTFDYEMERTDPDLAAHITVARARGVAVFGPPPSEIFATVSWRAYRAAVLGDISWSLDPQRFVAKPSYFVLNACRVLQLDVLGEGTIASKEEGALWALEALPAHRAVITAALESYRSAEPADNLRVEWAALGEFAGFVRAQIDAMRDK